MNNEFGKYLSMLRKSRALSLRQLGEQIDVSPTYISDVENGRRFPFNSYKLRLIVSALALTDEEKFTLYDLASDIRKEFPTDIAEYIKNNPIVIQAVRIASISNVPEEIWHTFIKGINKEVNINASN